MTGISIESIDKTVVCLLGETNTVIREELHGLLQKQYETATKNVRTTIQQLTTSQQTIQVEPYSQVQ